MDSELNSNMTGISTVHSWVPHLYDNNTKVRELTSASATYYVIGQLYFIYIYGYNLDFSGISMMLQIRNIPCTTILSGMLHFGSVADNGGNLTVQASNGAVYIRPNLTSASFSNPTASGTTTMVLIGRA